MSMSMSLQGKGFRFEFIMFSTYNALQITVKSSWGEPEKEKTFVQM